jgi:uncharacterized protein
MNTPTAFSMPAEIAAERISSFLKSVYSWMFVGLLVTAAVAAYVASTPSLIGAVVTNRLLFYGLMIGELGLVFYLSARVAKMSPGTATGLFILYAALNGVTLSVILLAYTGQSVANAFLVTGAMFGGMALYGSVTKRSLAGWGQFFFMGLIGIVVASVVGIFWKSDALQFVIAVIGVVVFTGLTAYDAQRLKQMALALPEGQTGSYSIVGALSLYLNFINLFLSLLRLFGGRRD